MRQSPLRYLPLCHPEIELTAGLRGLARIVELERAPAARVERLLRDLRAGFESDRLPIAPESSSTARQAFTGLHRLAYERLQAVFGDDGDAGAAVLAKVGVLCDLGDGLGYVDAPGAARHDDGRFASYRRYFTRQVPFAALPRDRDRVAAYLGIPPFTVALERRPGGESVDVTDDVADLLADRIPEVLAIVVHHSLGVQRLELGSPQFEERARRLRNLRVRRVDDLVIDARVEGLHVEATIGKGSTQDVFLEEPASAHPVLYHDLGGDDWQEALRRKLAPHLAALLQNSAYTATLALFLLAESDAEREEALHELGITADDVDGIRAGIGAVSDEERGRQRRWFAAIVAALTGDDRAVEPDDAVAALTAAGLSDELAARLAELGGGQAQREDVAPGGALAVLVANGFDLGALDASLRAADPADGLRVEVAQRRLSAWIRGNRRRLAAVLSLGRPFEEAKAAPDTWRAPSGLRFALDPVPAQWLAPVVESLRASGLEADPEALVRDPVTELIRAAGLADAAALEAQAALLYDPEERRHILRVAAAAWRTQLRLVGILERTGQGDSRAAILARADAVETLLPVSPAMPSELVGALGRLLPDHQSLVAAFAERITDAVSALPERESLLALAAEHGVMIGHLDAVERALERPQRELARRLQRQMRELESAALRPARPAGIRAIEATPPGARPRGKVHAVKVDPGGDARKRRLGDEGERWALAAVLGALVPLAPAARRTAIDEIVELLSLFDGAPVERALAHAAPACEPAVDDEELIDELRELLHVSRHSDGFGFDMLGWLAPSPDAPPAALCLEVKSARDGRFHLSRGEWNRARWFHELGQGERYAVLVVQRSTASGPPRRLDLLADPVALVANGQLAKLDDGYELAYRAG